MLPREISLSTYIFFFIYLSWCVKIPRRHEFNVIWPISIEEPAIFPSFYIQSIFKQHNQYFRVKWPTYCSVLSKWEFLLASARKASWQESNVASSSGDSLPCCCDHTFCGGLFCGKVCPWYFVKFWQQFLGLRKISDDHTFCGGLFCGK